MSNQFAKQGAFALSAIISSILVIAIVNIAFTKNPIVERILWVSFGVWVSMFLTFLFVKVISARREPEKNIPESDKWTSNVGGMLKIYD